MDDKQLAMVEAHWKGLQLRLDEIEARYIRTLEGNKERIKNLDLNNNRLENLVDALEVRFDTIRDKLLTEMGRLTTRFIKLEDMAYIKELKKEDAEKRKAAAKTKAIKVKAEKKAAKKPGVIARILAH